MTPDRNEDEQLFADAVKGLQRGDFSRLEPLFQDQPALEQSKSLIIEWYEKGYFEHQPTALAEALACACFNGCTRVAEFLLAQNVDPSAGNATGMNGFHWGLQIGASCRSSSC